MMTISALFRPLISLPRRHALPLFIILMTLAGCMGRIKGDVDGPGGTGQRTGFAGRVLMGPTCGNPIEGNPCQDKPISNTIFEVLDQEDKRVTTFQSDSKGYFQVVIAPGTYVVVPLKSIPLPNQPRQRTEVTVVAGQVTRMNLVFQTGIQ